MRASPTVVCEACGRDLPGGAVEMNQVGKQYDGDASWRAFECPRCQATGAVEERHGTSMRRYWGDATTEIQLVARDLSALEEGGGRVA